MERGQDIRRPRDGSRRGGDDGEFGGGGHDTLLGGLGKDTLTGGTGKDTFVFGTALNPVTNLDRIPDFRPADDVFQLKRSVFKGLASGPLSADAFVLVRIAKDGKDRILYDKSTGDLRYDPDGTGRAVAVKIATLANKAQLSHLDFVVF